MKKVTIKNAKGYGSTIDNIFYANGDDDMEVSDGYHTIDELYDHRIELYITLCRWIHNVCEDADPDSMMVPVREVWRSKLHADGSSYDGWFILGIGKERGEQISYHLPISRWDNTEFAETRDKAPEWDGHTPADVINRLKIL